MVTSPVLFSSIMSGLYGAGELYGGGEAANLSDLMISRRGTEQQQSTVLGGSCPWMRTARPKSALNSTFLSFGSTDSTRVLLPVIGVATKEDQSVKTEDGCQDVLSMLHENSLICFSYGSGGENVWLLRSWQYSASLPGWPVWRDQGKQRIGCGRGGDGHLVVTRRVWRKKAAHVFVLGDFL